MKTILLCSSIDVLYFQFLNIILLRFYVLQLRDVTLIQATTLKFNTVHWWFSQLRKTENNSLFVDILKAWHLDTSLAWA